MFICCSDLGSLFQAVESLSNIPAPELALRLYLQCAQVSTSLLHCIYLWQNFPYLLDVQVVFGFLL